MCGSLRRRRSKVNQILDNLVSFPTSWLLVCKVLGWVWQLRIPVLANVRVGVFLLIEVTKGVVNLSMLTLVCANWDDVSVASTAYT